MIFEVQLQGSRFEFDIIGNGFWSSTIWAIQIQVSYTEFENPKDLGIYPNHVVNWVAVCRLIAEGDAENFGIIEKMDESECEFYAIFITRMNQTEESTNENQDSIMEQFEEKVDRRILSNLENVMKWEKPTRIQMAAFDILLKVELLIEI